MARNSMSCMADVVSREISARDRDPENQPINGVCREPVLLHPTDTVRTTVPVSISSGACCFFIARFLSFFLSVVRFSFFITLYGGRERVSDSDVGCLWVLCCQWWAVQSSGSFTTPPTLRELTSFSLRSFPCREPSPGSVLVAWASSCAKLDSWSPWWVAPLGLIQPPKPLWSFLKGRPGWYAFWSPGHGKRVRIRFPQVTVTLAHWQTHPPRRSSKIKGPYGQEEPPQPLRRSSRRCPMR